MSDATDIIDRLKTSESVVQFDALLWLLIEYGGAWQVTRNKLYDVPVEQTAISLHEHTKSINEISQRLREIAFPQTMKNRICLFCKEN